MAKISKLFSYDVWSAVTLIHNDVLLVILNSSHSEARQESDLFHELAHIICDHQMSGFETVGNFILRNYDQNQEDEAEWLGGCLHIPRTSLEWAFRKNMTPLSISTYFKASTEMVTYRINVTGIKNQYKYYAAKYL